MSTEDKQLAEKDKKIESELVYLKLGIKKAEETLNKWRLEIIEKDKEIASYKEGSQQWKNTADYYKQEIEGYKNQLQASRQTGHIDNKWYENMIEEQKQEIESLRIAAQFTSDSEPEATLRNLVYQQQQEIEALKAELAGHSVTAVERIVELRKEIDGLYKGRRTNTILVEGLESKIKSQTEEIEALKQALRKCLPVVAVIPTRKVEINYINALSREIETLLK